MNNTEKVLKYGACFGKNFLVDGESVNPDWRIDEHSYHLLRNLFLQSDRDDRPEQVGLRIYYLDMCYGIQLYRRHSQYFDPNEGLYNGLARRLSELNKEKHLYKKIEEGDADAVNIIGRKLIARKKEFSFASKLCFFHNETAYPIWDTRVRGSLMYYKNLVKSEEDMSRKHGWIKNLKKVDPELLDYRVFKRVIDQFKKAFSLNVSYKQLDWYLWTFGGAIGVGEKKEDRKEKENKISKDTILSLQE